MRQNPYKTFFWILVAASVTGVGSSVALLFTLKANVSSIQKSLSQFKNDFGVRLTNLQNDNKRLIEWKGVMEGRYGKQQ